LAVEEETFRQARHQGYNKSNKAAMAWRAH